jgi:transposase
MRLSTTLNERSLRIWCATEAIAYDQINIRGGVSVVHQATGIARSTIYSGLKEQKKSDNLSVDRIRSQGGGRKKLTENHPDILQALESLVDPLSRGDPESPLRWTIKSLRKLTTELNRKGYGVSFRSVGDLLKELGYSLQGNKKVIEGSSHPDRDAQFNYINNKVNTYQNSHLPVISVDTKKKENIGAYKNKGREYSPKKMPIKVNTYDFADKQLGKVAPYGVYDITHNKGWVSVGVSHDTSEFAVQTIRTWWYRMGKALYPNSKEILITADGGGSNGSRVRLWKKELQKLANEIHMEIAVCHFPPGTSKWNKIEHRMFSFISQNWRGKPLLTQSTVIDLISATSTSSGLTITALLDEKIYEKGKKVSDEEFEKIKIERDEFHGEWNYKIKPE